MSFKFLTQLTHELQLLAQLAARSFEHVVPEQLKLLKLFDVLGRREERASMSVRREPLYKAENKYVMGLPIQSLFRPIPCGIRS